MKKVLFTCCADYKTVCIFEFIYSRAVKQKVWNKAEKGERDWRETLFSGLASLGVWDIFSHCHCHCVYPSGASHSTQNRKFRLEIKWNRPMSLKKSNGTDHFGSVRPEYLTPPLKVVYFDRSGQFGRSDRNFPFYLTKLLSPVPLFWIQHTRTITKRAVAWVGSVLPECTVPLGTWNFRNFKPKIILLNGKRRRFLSGHMIALSVTCAESFASLTLE